MIPRKVAGQPSEIQRDDTAPLTNDIELLGGERIRTITEARRVEHAVPAQIAVRDRLKAKVANGLEIHDGLRTGIQSSHATANMCSSPGGCNDAVEYSTHAYERRLINIAFDR